MKKKEYVFTKQWSFCYNQYHICLAMSFFSIQNWPFVFVSLPLNFNITIILLKLTATLCSGANRPLYICVWENARVYVCVEPDYQPCRVGAENWVQVLWKSSQHSWPLRHLSHIRINLVRKSRTRQLQCPGSAVQHLGKWGKSACRILAFRNNRLL